MGSAKVGFTLGEDVTKLMAATGVEVVKANPAKGGEVRLHLRRVKAHDGDGVSKNLAVVTLNPNDPSRHRPQVKRAIGQLKKTSMGPQA